MTERPAKSSNAAPPTEGDVLNLSPVVQSLNGGSHRFAVLLHDVLSPEECRNWIQGSEDKGYEPALLNIGGGQQIRADETRNNERCIIDDYGAAESLYQKILAKLQVHAPDLKNDFVQRQHQTRGGNPLSVTSVGLNERLRILRYDPGTYFAPHFDGAYRRNQAAGGPPHRVGECSQVTLLLYLNGGYKGGATRFLQHEDSSQGYTVPSRAGSVLLFDHDVLHEGATLEVGRKYIVRTDVMYTTKGPGFEYSKGF